MPLAIFWITPSLSVFFFSGRLIVTNAPPSRSSYNTTSLTRRVLQDGVRRSESKGPPAHGRRTQDPARDRVQLIREAAPMDFELPADLAAYLTELDEFIER